MDLHIWSLLCHHSVHTLIPQLQNMVISWSRNDYLHCLVHDHCSHYSWPGDLILRSWFWWVFWVNSFSSVDLTQTCFKVEGVKHSGPDKLVLYFTGATNILYTFGGHAVTVWVINLTFHILVFFVEITIMLFPPSVFCGLSFQNGVFKFLHSGF